MPNNNGVDVARAFGAANRIRLLDEYFERVAAEDVTAESAWRHVYRLLMWIDRTIGLAHCYESDKCQPGRPWYSRSLQFHSWLSSQLGVQPRDLAAELDWLFTSAAQELAFASQMRAEGLRIRADEQRSAFGVNEMPEPGKDLELERIISETIEHSLKAPPPQDLASTLSERVMAYISGENKRKNLVGEGFEDALAAILRRLPAVMEKHDIYVRPALHDLPGFNRPRGGDKTRVVDLALVGSAGGRRTLVSCKWSVRSDREEQFATDFETYDRLEASGKSFNYVLLTNEFDPARLAAACDMRRSNQEIFTSVVHVNSAGPRAVYSMPVQGSRSATAGMRKAMEHIDSGRLSSLESWLNSLQV